MVGTERINQYLRVVEDKMREVQGLQFTNTDASERREQNLQL